MPQAGLKDGDVSYSLMHKAPCLAQGEAGSYMLRYKALGLILRLACDLPTMESMLETLCVLFSSALGQRRRQSKCENQKGIFGLYTAPTLCQVPPECWSRVHTIHCFQIGVKRGLDRQDSSHWLPLILRLCSTPCF